MKLPGAEHLLDFEFDLEASENEPSWRTRKGITFFVDEKDWERYHSIQGRTKKKFGKEMKKLLLKAIDKVDPSKAS